MRVWRWPSASNLCGFISVRTCNVPYHMSQRNLQNSESSSCETWRNKNLCNNFWRTVSPTALNHCMVLWLHLGQSCSAQWNHIQGSLVSSFHHLDKFTITRFSHKSRNIIKDKIPLFYHSVFWKVLQNPAFQNLAGEQLPPYSHGTVKHFLCLPQHMYNIGLNTCSHSQSSITLHTAQLMTQTAFVNMFIAI